MKPDMQQGRERLARGMATGFTGSAAEHHVAAQLAERDWAVSLTRAGLARTDLLAQYHTGSPTVAVQVKSSTGGDFNIGLSGIAPSPPGGGEWTILVLLSKVPGERPTFFVAPRNHIATAGSVWHTDWISHMRRDGEPRKNTSMRTARLVWLEGYREAWDLLHEHPDELPWRYPEEFWTILARHGIPDGHLDPFR